MTHTPSMTARRRENSAAAPRPGLPPGLVDRHAPAGGPEATSSGGSGAPATAAPRGSTPAAVTQDGGRPTPNFCDHSTAAAQGPCSCPTARPSFLIQLPIPT